MAAPTTGKLRLELMEARLTRDTETFSKMDPYCKIRYREQMVKSKTMNNAGKTPKWNQIFDFDIKYIGDDFYIECLDEDLTSSDMIGQCQVKCSAFTANGGIDEWYELQYKGKRSGLLHIKTKWIPDGMNQQDKSNLVQNSVLNMMGQQRQPMMNAPMGYNMMGAPPQQAMNPQGFAMTPQQTQMMGAAFGMGGGFPPHPAQMQQQPMQGYPPQQQMQGYPPQQQMQGYPPQQQQMQQQPMQGYPPQQQGYPPQQPGQQPGYPPQQQQMQQQPMPQQPNQGYPPQQQMQGYPPQQQGYPPQQQGYPPQGYQ